MKQRETMCFANDLNQRDKGVERTLLSHRSDQIGSSAGHTMCSSIQRQGPTLSESLAGHSQVDILGLWYVNLKVKTKRSVGLRVACKISQPWTVKRLGHDCSAGQHPRGLGRERGMQGGREEGGGEEWRQGGRG